MQDEIELTLPVSKKKVVIRNYTTRGDDEKAEAVLYKGVKATANSENQGANVDIPLANAMKSQEIYVDLLVKSIDGEDNVSELLRELRTPDYQAVADKVEQIVENDSPKVNKGSDSNGSGSNKK